MEQNRAKCS